MPYQKMEMKVEKKLIEKAKRDKAAFGVLYTYYFTHILNYALRRLGDVGAAQEVTSDTFFEAMNDIKKFEWRGVSFSSWLYKIATNNINSYFRKKNYKLISLDFLFAKHDFEVPDGTDIEQEAIDAQEELERHEDFLSVQRNLLELSLKYQEVLALRYFEKKKLQEISDILGKKESTVKSLLSRGIEKLQKKWKEEKGGEARATKMQPFFIKSALPVDEEDL